MRNLTPFVCSLVESRCAKLEDISIYGQLNNVTN